MCAVDHHSSLIRIHDHAFSKDGATTCRFGNSAFEQYLRELDEMRKMRAARIGELCYKGNRSPVAIAAHNASLASHITYPRRCGWGFFRLAPDLFVR